MTATADNDLTDTRSVTPSRPADGAGAFAGTIPFTRCADCGAEIDLYCHVASCPQAPLPEVIALGPGRWMVASKTYAPGAYFPVALIHVGARTAYRCECPAGQRYSAMSLDEQADARGCRHLKAVLAYQQNQDRRPSYPVDAGSFCD